MMLLNTAHNQLLQEKINMVPQLTYNICKLIIENWSCQMYKFHLNSNTSWEQQRPALKGTIFIVRAKVTTVSKPSI